MGEAKPTLEIASPLVPGGSWAMSCISQPEVSVTGSGRAAAAAWAFAGRPKAMVVQATAKAPSRVHCAEGKKAEMFVFIGVGGLKQSALVLSAWFLVLERVFRFTLL